MGTHYNRLIEAVLMSTHNLCFRAKIRKKVYPCTPQFYYIKVGCKGVYFTRTGYHDVILPLSKIEPRHEKTVFLFAYAKKKTQISAIVFATQIVQFLYFLNTKFEASTHIMCLHSPVCVRPGRKPRRPVFSQRGSFETF